MKAIVVMGSLGVVWFLLSSSAWSLQGEDFELPWHTIDGGGGHSSGGVFELSGTIGQADAGRIAGGKFALTGGLWFELLPGDGNEDGAVTLLDAGGLASCMEGPATQPPSSLCEGFDGNGDGFVDMADFAIVQAGFTHP